MKAIQEGRTVVLVGGWNMSILTPQWISQHLLEQANLDVEVLVRPGNQPTLRYRTAQFILTPSPRRLTFNILDGTDATLSKTEEIVIKLLRDLPHTPVSAAGVNFRFCEDDQFADLARLFNFSDGPDLAGFGARTSEAQIQRTLRIDDHIVLNLKVIYDTAKVVFDFNYHVEVTPAPDLTTTNAIERLQNTFVPRKELSLKLLREVYDRELTENEE